MENSIRKKYDSFGVSNYYKDFANEYLNPHNEYVKTILQHLIDDGHFKNTKNLLDFACGDGLVSKYLQNKIPEANIFGCDKFLYERYEKETGLECFSYSFEDLSSFKFNLPIFDTVIISYAIDLIEDSYLSNFLYFLHLNCKKIIIIRPNKHVLNSPYWNPSNYFKQNKSHCRIYT